MAAEHAAEAIGRAICDRGQARIIAATAASQFEFLDALTKMPGIDWQKVEVFHLDEYIGLPITHPGSFRKMLLDHLIKKTGIAKYHLLDGDADPAEVVRRVGKELTSAPIDVAFVGTGLQVAHSCNRNCVSRPQFWRVAESSIADMCRENRAGMSTRGPHASSKVRPIPPLRWWIGGLLFASSVINYIDRQTLSLLAPYLKLEYHWSNTDYANLVIAFRVAYSVGQTIFGRFMDRV